MATVAPSANDLTRQQLDELDALLQRMLSLPLNPPESFAPNPPAQSYALPMPTPAPVVREVSAPAPRLFTNPTPAPEIRQTPEPSPVAVPWKDFTPTPAPVPAPSPKVEKPAPAPKVEKPRPVPVPKPAPLAVEPVVYVPQRPEPVPFLLVPLVGFNAALNWSLGLFGLPGRVLRSGFVKNLFGLAGIGLLVYTSLKVAQIHGLVTLPVQLPWPR